MPDIPPQPYLAAWDEAIVRYRKTLYAIQQQAETRIESDVTLRKIHQLATDALNLPKPG